MRLSVLVAALAVAVPFGLGAGSASAQSFEGQSFLGGRVHGPNAPWCSHENTGGENVQEDCSFDSFESCRRLAMGVNNTFCTPNPAYNMNVQPNRKKKGSRVRR